METKTHEMKIDSKGKNIKVNLEIPSTLAGLSEWTGEDNTYTFALSSILARTRNAITTAMNEEKSPLTQEKADEKYGNGWVAKPGRVAKTAEEKLSDALDTILEGKSPDEAKAIITAMAAKLKDSMPEG